MAIKYTQGRWGARDRDGADVYTTASLSRGKTARCSVTQLCSALPSLTHPANTSSGRKAGALGVFTPKPCPSWACPVISDAGQRAPYHWPLCALMRAQPVAGSVTYILVWTDKLGASSFYISHVLSCHYTDHEGRESGVSQGGGYNTVFI